MRKTTAKLLTVALLLSATAALAQRGGHGPGGPRGNRIDFLATVLSLTDAQKTQATAIFEAAETASTTLRETQAQALNDAAKSNAADAAIDQLAATLGSTSGQLAAIQIKAFARFYALLTTEQRTKLDELKTNGRGIGELSFGPGLP